MGWGSWGPGTPGVFRVEPGGAALRRTTAIIFDRIFAPNEWLWEGWGHGLARARFDFLFGAVRTKCRKQERLGPCAGLIKNGGRAALVVGGCRWLSVVVGCRRGGPGDAAYHRDRVSGLGAQRRWGRVGERPRFCGDRPQGLVAQVLTGLWRRRAPRDRLVSPPAGGTEARSPALTGTPRTDKHALGGTRRDAAPESSHRGPCHSNVPLMSQSYSAHVTVMSRQCHSRGVSRLSAATGQHAGVVSDRPLRARLGASDRADAALPHRAGWPPGHGRPR